MKKLPENLFNDFLIHAKKEAPLEACGYLAGNDDLIEHFYPMENVDKSRTHYTLNPQEQFAVVKDARKNGFKLLAVCHSHPETPARPSQEDIDLAYDPEITYVILSLVDNSIKAFKINSGEVSKEEFVIIKDNGEEQ